MWPASPLELTPDGESVVENLVLIADRTLTARCDPPYCRPGDVFEVAPPVDAASRRGPKLARHR